MSNNFGNNIKVTIFGQSHSPAIGVSVDGLPAGFAIDFDELNAFMQRRRPGQGKHTTTRNEPDEPEFISGLVDGVTCGSVLTAIIRNKDVKSSDYDDIKDIPRPSHADFTAFIKYGSAHDIRGGGAFSGRLTAPLCIAGGICLQLLKNEGISIAAHITQIGNVQAKGFDPVNVGDAEFSALKSAAFPVLDAGVGELMLAAIEEVRQAGDSLGGIIECAVIGLPAGVGEPMFDGMENRLASILFGIPAVKGVEFGNGFAAAGLKGSENNDAFIVAKQGDSCSAFETSVSSVSVAGIPSIPKAEQLSPCFATKIKTRTNNHGGILGGITSGMPLIFRTAIKPTPSIAIEQDSVSLSSLEPRKLTIKGRHDPCIVPRAVPCIEAAAAIAIYDAMQQK
ncbi:MAG: chorismate synthase [Oscillospiraceae bacterium]|nr:chorismate synthase [Oscillospiraceae bacterium]